MAGGETDDGGLLRSGDGVRLTLSQPLRIAQEEIFGRDQCMRAPQPGRAIEKSKWNQFWPGGRGGGPTTCSEPSRLPIAPKRAW